MASELAAASGELGAAVGIFLLPVLADAWGLTLVMVEVAAVSFLGFLVTAIFGAGLETIGRALEVDDDAMTKGLVMFESGAAG